MERAIEPVRVKDTNGQERKFLLTRGAIRRIREQLKVKTIQDVLKKISADEDGAMAVFLYHCMLDRNGLSLEEFEETMPFNIEHDNEIVSSLLGVSLTPENAARPIDAPTPAIQ